MKKINIVKHEEAISLEERKRNFVQVPLMIKPIPIPKDKVQNAVKKI